MEKHLDSYTQITDPLVDVARTGRICEGREHNPTWLRTRVSSEPSQQLVHNPKGPGLEVMAL